MGPVCVKMLRKKVLQDWNKREITLLTIEYRFSLNSIYHTTAQMASIINFSLVEGLPAVPDTKKKQTNDTNVESSFFSSIKKNKIPNRKNNLLNLTIIIN
jgi:hypothetical protein